jgi:uncharacterized membrane protein
MNGDTVNMLPYNVVIVNIDGVKETQPPMAQLLILLLILIGTYGGLTIARALTGLPTLSASLRGRISIAVLFGFTGLSHFFMPEQLAQLLPPALPYQLELIYLTGVLEILGAIGLLVPRLARLASVALILFLLGVLPANIYGALTAAPFGAHDLGPIYLLARIPFQAVLIGWLYYFGVHTLSRTPSTSASRSGSIEPTALG